MTKEDKKDNSQEKVFKRKSQAREWAESIAIALILALIVRTFVVQAFKIPSSSMEDTLLIGDHLLVNKFIYGTAIPFTNIKVLPLRNPQRGDIIVFEYPEDREESFFNRRDFIKRIIGLPGERVKMVNQVVHINNEPYTIPQEVHKEKGINKSMLDARLFDFDELVVPEGHYFVMGDNRDRSSDSRYWGYVPEENIKGKAFILYWSWDKGRFLPRVTRIGNLIN